MYVKRTQFSCKFCTKLKRERYGERGNPVVIKRGHMYNKKRKLMAISLDYSRVEIAVAARPQPMKL